MGALGDTLFGSPPVRDGKLALSITLIFYLIMMLVFRGVAEAFDFVGRDNLTNSTGFDHDVQLCPIYHKENEAKSISYEAKYKTLVAQGGSRRLSPGIIKVEDYKNYTDVRDNYRHGKELCFATQVTHRMCWAIAGLFFILMIFSLLGMGVGAVTKLGILKFLTPICFFFINLLIPDYIWDYAAYVAGFLSIIAFIYGFVLILNFAAKWHTSWVENNERQNHENKKKGNAWTIGLYAISILLLGGSVTAAVLLSLNTVFHDASHDKDHSSHKSRMAMVIANASVMFFLGIVSILPFVSHGSFFVSMMMMLLMMTFSWGSVYHYYEDVIGESLWSSHIAYIAIAILWFSIAVLTASTECNEPLKKKRELYAGIDELESEWSRRQEKPKVDSRWTALWCLFMASVPLAFSVMISRLPYPDSPDHWFLSANKLEDTGVLNVQFWIMQVMIFLGWFMYALYLLAPVCSEKKYYGKYF